MFKAKQLKNCFCLFSWFAFAISPLETVGNDPFSSFADSA
jgi:hypothetical protein